MGALVGIGELIKIKTPGKRLLERGREGAELNQNKGRDKGGFGRT